MFLSCDGELFLNLQAVNFIRELPGPIEQVSIHSQGELHGFCVTGPKAAHVKQNFYPVLVQLSSQLYINPTMLIRFQRVNKKYTLEYQGQTLTLDDFESKAFHDRVVNPSPIIAPGSLL